jgi:hypothetical protein
VDALELSADAATTFGCGCGALTGGNWARWVPSRDKSSQIFDRNAGGRWSSRADTRTWAQHIPIAGWGRWHRLPACGRGIPGCGRGIPAYGRWLQPVVAGVSWLKIRRTWACG